ncbi:acyl-CoA dehydrogenase family protein [Amycolatopsis endophytica]|uniref:Alkylation response protein AidB-like acyl-CoA dehydrogenase n=1 Tax=Amycolatopsis endophytica TaxID=860233 RepID=A0A853B1Y7_9PSEU|nr:acyl-CoA dehydrogenase family protein [Amycolatopsis endophytica]NYI88834.1 alkylation response protein AidB-like acyl-CoA dehydrogenase [Amycolatopsis endophytica]
MNLAPTELTGDELRLQSEVRSFLDERLPAGSYPVQLGIGGCDPAFSRDLARRGWVGMAISRQYGGHGRSAVDRLVVVEQLLARGAPVAYHWIADRQSGPMIERHGSEAQKRELLPGIARGELSFSIGMSEPDSGSDLASLRSRAQWRSDRWVLNGTKIWTTGAAQATHILGLFRTSEDRYGGLTQFIVGCDTPGVTISPIVFIDGSSEFCEVSFEDVELGDEHRLGEPGAGWAQNTGELVLERGGVDRWMSMFPVIEHWASELAPEDSAAQADLGTITARMWALRGLSLSIARLVDEGGSPVTEAAMVKELATRWEADCVRLVARHLGRAPDPTSPDPWEALLARAVLVSPSWTIRGGTNEILRSVVAKGLARR